MVKVVKAIPAKQYNNMRDAWYDDMLDGQIKQIEESDWTGRFEHVRSAASSLRQAAERRGLSYVVAVRGQDIYVQPGNGAVKKAAPAKVAAKKVVAKKATPRKRTAKAS